MTNPVGGLSQKPNLVVNFETKAVSKLSCCEPKKSIPEQNDLQFNGKINNSKPTFSVLA